VKLLYLLAMVAIGCTAASAQTEDFYKPKMTKAEAVAYLRQRNIAMVPDILPQTILSGDVKGLDLKAKGTFPQTPLDLAMMSCPAGARVRPEEKLRMVDLLLGGGADPNQGMAVLPTLMIDDCRSAALRARRHQASAGSRGEDGYPKPKRRDAARMALEVRNYEGAQTLIDAGARISPEAGRKILDGSDDDPHLVEVVARATAAK